MNSTRRMAFQAAGLSLIIAWGCGTGDSKPFPNMVLCSGEITFDGKPLDHGTVTFAPIDPNGESAYGKISNGQFQMMTTVSAPGVIKGQYRVKVESLGPPPPKVPGQMPLPGISLIPEKYGNPQTSGLEVDIQKKNSPVKLELVSH